MLSRLGASILDAEQTLQTQLAVSNEAKSPRIGTKSQTWASNTATLLMALQQQQARCVDLLQKIDAK